jgi:hypothetical protein
VLVVSTDDAFVRSLARLIQDTCTIEQVDGLEAALQTLMTPRAIDSVWTERCAPGPSAGRAVLSAAALRHPCASLILLTDRPLFEVDRDLPAGTRVFTKNDLLVAATWMLRSLPPT